MASWPATAKDGPLRDLFGLRECLPQSQPPQPAIFGKWSAKCYADKALLPGRQKSRSSSVLSISTFLKAEASAIMSAASSNVVLASPASPINLQISSIV
jgi:hypothetical protein